MGPAGPSRIVIVSSGLLVHPDFKASLSGSAACPRDGVCSAGLHSWGDGVDKPSFSVLSSSQKLELIRLTKSGPWRRCTICSCTGEEVSGNLFVSCKASKLMWWRWSSCCIPPPRWAGPSVCLRTGRWAGNLLLPNWKKTLLQTGEQVFKTQVQTVSLPKTEQGKKSTGLSGIAKL